VPIQTVFLDAGGVLVNPNWTRVSAALAERGVIVSADRLEAAEPYAKRRLDAGELIRATNDAQRGWTYFNLVLGEAGVPLSDATDAALAGLNAYHQEFNLWESVPEAVLPSLAALRACGFRLAVVSNANGTLHRVFERLQLKGAVDALFDSCDEGVEKPDPRFFRLALERVGATPDTTVHVGDLFHVDVVGARAADIKPVLLDIANLYGDADCLRVQSLPALVELLKEGLTT
jgi:putative hydrolase of the HAD superfamily